MSPQPPGDNPSSKSPVPIRLLLGVALGGAAGAVLGWLIDRAITDDPYGGVRIGAFVGTLCGGVLSMGTGWRGIGMVLSIVLWSAGGSLLALALGNPSPGSFTSLIPTFIGGILGAFIGLALGVTLIRRRRPSPPTGEGIVNK